MVTYLAVTIDERIEDQKMQNCGKLIILGQVLKEDYTVTWIHPLCVECGRSDLREERAQAEM
jgi:hypothetical protein